MTQYNKWTSSPPSSSDALDQCFAEFILSLEAFNGMVEQTGLSDSFLASLLEQVLLSSFDSTAWEFLDEFVFFRRMRTRNTLASSKV